MKETSKLAKVWGDARVSLKGNVDFSNLVGRKVTEFSTYCGTYGQGGPGFVGFKLEANHKEPEEWLILCLWNAAGWLNVNGQWLGAYDKHYYIQKPLLSNFPDQKWDEFSPLIVGCAISRFEVSEKSCSINVGKANIVLSENPEDRSPYPSGKLRELLPSDDLRQAWILATAPWVNV